MSNVPIFQMTPYKPHAYEMELVFLEDLFLDDDGYLLYCIPIKSQHLSGLNSVLHYLEKSTFYLLAECKNKGRRILITRTELKGYFKHPNIIEFEVPIPFTIRKITDKISFEIMLDHTAADKNNVYAPDYVQNVNKEKATFYTYHFFPRLNRTSYFLALKPLNIELMDSHFVEHGIIYTGLTPRLYPNYKFHTDFSEFKLATRKRVRRTHSRLMPKGKGVEENEIKRVRTRKNKSN